MLRLDLEANGIEAQSWTYVRPPVRLCRRTMASLSRLQQLTGLPCDVLQVLSGCDSRHTGVC